MQKFKYKKDKVFLQQEIVRVSEMQVACQLVIAAHKRDAIGDLYETDINACWTWAIHEGEK